MSSDFERNLSDSAYDFLHVVWPVVKPWCGGGEIESVEMVSAEHFSEQLDVEAGIDAFQIVKGEGIRGVASRIQWGPCYESFTIRESRPSGRPTEYQKRMRALDNKKKGWLFPTITVQAYLNERRTGKLLGVGMIYTEDLYQYLKNGIAGIDFERDFRNPDDDSTFIVVWWDDLRSKGIKVDTLITEGVNTINHAKIKTA